MAAQKKNDMKSYIHVIIGVLLMLGIGFLPAREPITEYGMHVLGIFVGMVYLWITSSVLWPSVLGIVAMMLLGQDTPGNIIAAAFGTDTVWFIIFISVLLIPMTQEHVTEFIAKFFLTRKFAQGRPWVFIYLFTFTTFVVAMIANAVPAIMLMWAILYSIFEVSSIKRSDSISGYLVFSVVYGAALGTATFPFKGAMMIILNAFTKVSEIPVNMVGYWILAMIVSAVLILALVILGKFVFKIDTSKLTNTDVNGYFTAKGLVKMSIRQKSLLILLAVNTLLLVWPSVMPKGWWTTTMVNRMGSFGSTALVLVVMMVVRMEGKPLIDYKSAATKLGWDIVFLVAAALYVAGQLSNADSGIVPFIKTLLGSVITGGSEIWILLFFLALGFIVTNFANNAAMGVMLMPVLFAATQNGPYHAVVIAACLAMVLFQAFLTPSASPHASLLHGNKEWISAKDIYRYAVPVSLISILLIALVGYPLGLVLLG